MEWTPDQNDSDGASPGTTPPLSPSIWDMDQYQVFRWKPSNMESGNSNVENQAPPTSKVSSSLQRQNAYPNLANYSPTAISNQPVEQLVNVETTALNKTQELVDPGNMEAKKVKLPPRYKRYNRPWMKELPPKRSLSSFSQSGAKTDSQSMPTISYTLTLQEETQPKKLPAYYYMARRELANLDMQARSILVPTGSPLESGGLATLENQQSSWTTSVDPTSAFLTSNGLWTGILLLLSKKDPILSYWQLALLLQQTKTHLSGTQRKLLAHMVSMRYGEESIASSTFQKKVKS